MSPRDTFGQRRTSGILMLPEGIVAHTGVTLHVFISRDRHVIDMSPTVMCHRVWWRCSTACTDAPQWRLYTAEGKMGNDTQLQVFNQRASIHPSEQSIIIREMGHLDSPENCSRAAVCGSRNPSNLKVDNNELQLDNFPKCWNEENGKISTVRLWVLIKEKLPGR